MKNLILTVIASLYVMTASTQSKTKYGVQASGIMSTASFNESGNDHVNKDYNTGFGAGLYAEFPVGSKLSIKPGINYMKKGVKVSSDYTDDGTLYKQNVKANLNYLEVPVLAIYNFKGTDGKWFLGAGPSASYGISGKLKGDVEFNDGESVNRESYSVNAFDKDSDNGGNFKRMDYGLAAVAGRNINKNLAVQLNYLHGLSNIASSSIDSNKFKNRNMMLSLNYKI